MVADPKLKAPGMGKKGYALLAGPPAIKGGRVINGTASKDYYGNSVVAGSIPSIGIENHK